MSDPPVVSNSSALIALNQIGQLDLLQQLFSVILIPPAVKRETELSVVLPGWIFERPLAQPLPPNIAQASLDEGEREAIGLATEVQAAKIILDDLAARRFAESLGLTVVGTLGILLAAKRHGFLPAVRPCLEALVAHEFHLTPQLYDHVLEQAGEL